MTNAVLAIAITEAKLAIENPKDIKDAARMAMKHMMNFWLSIDNDVRFKGAVGGVMEFYGHGSTESEAIEWEIKRLAKADVLLKAASLGMPVDIGETDEGKTPIGLLRMWCELLRGGGDA